MLGWEFLAFKTLYKTCFLIFWRMFQCHFYHIFYLQNQTIFISYFRHKLKFFPLLNLHKKPLKAFPLVPDESPLVRSTLAAKINFVAKISHASDRNSDQYVFKTISVFSKQSTRPPTELFFILYPSSSWVGDKLASFDKPPALAMIVAAKNPKEVPSYLISTSNKKKTYFRKPWSELRLILITRVLWVICRGKRVLNRSNKK